MMMISTHRAPLFFQVFLRTGLATAMAWALAVLVVSCRHAPPAPPPPPSEKSSPEAEKSTITSRIQILGQEIADAADRVADRMKPDLDRLEKKRVDLLKKIKHEGARVNHRVMKSLDSLEDDLRVLRARITGPEPRSQTPEPDDTDSSE